MARTWDIPVTYKLDQRAERSTRLSRSTARATGCRPASTTCASRRRRRANSPGTINGTALIVGNAGLIMKQSQQREIWVWAVDMGSGKPLAGRAVRIARPATKPLGTATTDADGLAHVSVDLEPYKGQPLALLEDGGDAAVVASWWNDSIGPWNFDLSIKDRKYNNGMALYTDRAIYRPGQTVYFKGIVRDDDDGRYSVPGGAGRRQR